MADIFHDFPVNAPPAAVFAGLSTPAGLDTWWTRASSGDAVEGGAYELDFGPGYVWRARVTRCVPDRQFELELTEADDDWRGTRVAFTLEDRSATTLVRFGHLGWPESNGHYRTSSFCWAMYLRILKRRLEHGEAVPYERRLDV